MSSTAATSYATAATATNDSVTASAAAAAAYEDEHVHSVYQHIAPHFSSTRYKPWPIVERFLQRLAPGSIGLDAGCGNGKYLAVNRNVFIVASDRSLNLTRIAATAHASTTPHAVCVADTLHLPHPRHTFDFAICIAVVHHLSTPARRVAGIAALLETLRRPADALPDPSDPTNSPRAAEPTADHVKNNSSRNDGGKVLIFVWALEQKGSRRGWDAGGEQDVMVPWVLSRAAAASSSSTPTSKPGRRKNHKASNPGEATGSQEAPLEEIQDTAAEPQVHNRYYHLYRAGELEADIRSAGGVVLESGYERDNWWAVASPGGSFTTAASLGITNDSLDTGG